MQLSIQQEKFRAAEKGGRAIGENKPKLTDKDKEEALKRKNIEEYIKRMQQMEANGQNKGFMDMLQQKFKEQQQAQATTAEGNEKKEATTATTTPVETPKETQAASTAESGEPASSGKTKKKKGGKK